MPRFPSIGKTPDRFDGEGNRVCRNCDNPVAGGRRHYCSGDCMWEFYRNNTWSLVRLDVLRRDRFTCSICRKRKGRALLEVDHMIPVRKGVDPFDKGNLRTLCRECHRAKTKLERDF